MPTLTKPDEIYQRANEYLDEINETLVPEANDSKRYRGEYLQELGAALDAAVGQMAAIAHELGRLREFSLHRCSDAKRTLQLAELDVRCTEVHATTKGVEAKRDIVLRATTVQREEVRVWDLAKMAVENALEIWKIEYDAMKRQESGVRMHTRLIHGDHTPGQEGHSWASPPGRTKFAPSPDDDAIEVD